MTLHRLQEKLTKLNCHSERSEESICFGNGKFRLCLFV